MNFVHLIWQWAGANQAVLGLLFVAFVVNMPEELPYPINVVPIFVWLYGWFHTSLKAFVNFRSPSVTKRSSE